MSAQTIHELDLTTEALPSALTQPRLPRQRTAATHLALVPDLVSPSGGRVRITRRGRLLVTLALMAAVAVVAFALAGPLGASADPGRPSGALTTRTVVVQPGQTLWSLAGEVAPGTDRRTTIARLVELNHLPSTDVAAGARLVVPTR